MKCPRTAAGHPRAAGFAEIRITPKESRELLQTWGAGTTLADVICSANIQAVRPA